MGKTVRTIVMMVLLVGLVSCATIYTRNWQYESSPISDSLTISGETFRLERTSPEGTAVYEGKFRKSDTQWVFDVATYTAPKGGTRQYDPLVRYKYSVKEFANGVSFLSFDVEGRLGVNFIQRGDFSLK